MAVERVDEPDPGTAVTCSTVPVTPLNILMEKSPMDGDSSSVKKMCLSSNTDIVLQKWFADGETVVVLKEDDAVNDDNVDEFDDDDDDCCCFSKIETEELNLTKSLPLNKEDGAETTDKRVGISVRVSYSLKLPPILSPISTLTSSPSRVW